MAKRSALLCVPALVAGVIVAVVPPAAASLPPGATQVPVVANFDAAGIDPQLNNAGSIAGSVTAATGGGALYASVNVYLNGQFIRSGTTNPATGAYLVGGLGASATGYVVCVAGVQVYAGGSSTTGYRGRCYAAAAFDGSTPPASATKIPLTAGGAATNIDLSLPSGAGISGKVSNGAGTGIGSTSIVAKNRSTGSTFNTSTQSDGTYKFIGLTPSATGYSVCANPAFSTAGATGFRPRCYNNVAWDGRTIPAGATAVSVTLGHTHSGINIKLPPGAAISGKVTDASNGHPVVNGGVVIFSSTGRRVATTGLTAQGNYVAKGLRAATNYRVCEFPASGTTPTLRYKGQCWKNVTWNGASLPSGTTKVGTAIGHTRTGINFKLTRVIVHYGSIAGTITEQAGGNPLQNARVVVYNPHGGQATSTTTDETGHYAFPYLLPNSTGYRICAQAVSSTFDPLASTPIGGWAPRCYNDVSWNGGAVPAGATKLTLTSGQSRISVNVALHVGGSISGTTFQSDGTTAATSVPVSVYTPSGQLLAQTSSDLLDGTYMLADLAPSATGYVVCFDGRDPASGGAGYLPECWQDQAWDGSA